MGCHSTKNCQQKQKAQNHQNIKIPSQSNSQALSSSEKTLRQKVYSIKFNHQEFQNPTWKLLFLDQNIMNSSIMSRRNKILSQMNTIANTKF